MDSDNGFAKNKKIEIKIIISKKSKFTKIEIIPYVTYLKKNLVNLSLMLIFTVSTFTLFKINWQTVDNWCRSIQINHLTCLSRLVQMSAN